MDLRRAKDIFLISNNIQDKHNYKKYSTNREELRAAVAWCIDEIERLLDIISELKKKWIKL